MPIVDGEYELPENILKEKHGTAEYRLHVAFIDYLRGEKRVKNKPFPIKKPFPDLFDDMGYQKFTHIAQGRDKTEGFFLHRMGLRAGPLDLMFWHPDLFFMDAKVKGNDYTKPQSNFCRHMEKVAVPTFKFHTVAEGRDILISLGLKCENHLVNEPAMSKHNQQLAYLEMMKP